jgi:hypothetical protein
MEFHPNIELLQLAQPAYILITECYIRLARFIFSSIKKKGLL